jgi:hypothetical protein
MLKAGDTVPADIHIVEASGLQVDTTSIPLYSELMADLATSLPRQAQRSTCCS